MKDTDIMQLAIENLSIEQLARCFYYHIWNNYMSYTNLAINIQDKHQNTNINVKDILTSFNVMRKLSDTLHKD